MNKQAIAFLTRSLVDATGSNMWKGIESQCKADNIPLVTFRGPILNKGQGSIIYNIISDNSFSGVISWASSDVDQKAIEYYQKYVNTPLVCMTFKIPGHPVIITDCKTGIMELMDHLIEVHNFTRIAFIRGPENHVYARERYEGYIESLNKHNLSVDEQLITPCGGWAILDGTKGADYFIGNGLKPGRDFQAVVCVGDNVAIGAQERLLKCGYSVPHDVAVCGFNGTEDAAWSNPPITTVEMPFAGLGVKGYEILKSLTNGQTVPEEIRYNTKIIIGESCGCTSHSVLRANFIKERAVLSLKKGAIKSKIKDLPLISDIQVVPTLKSTTWQEKVRAEIMKIVADNRYSNSAVTNFFDGFSIRLTASLVSDLVNEDEPPVFIKTISAGLNKFIEITKEFSVWQDIISVLRNAFLTELSHGDLYCKTENLLQQSRIIINEVDCRTQKQNSLLEARKEAALRAASTSILSCSDIDDLMNIIAKSIKTLGINSVYVAMYNNCRYSEKNPVVPEKSTVILAVTNGERITLPAKGLSFKTEDILPNSICNSSDYASYVVESLHYQDQFMGYIVFEGEQSKGVTYSTLRDLISCSLYSAILLRQRNESRGVLENTMQRMTEKADNVSRQSEGISGNITTISNSMDSVAENIRDISDNIATVNETLTYAKRVVSDANAGIENLVEDTEQISHSIYRINDIAEKTNVLALNAAIEAAHAGEAGKRFSVVAKEVKSLAAQTVAATQSIQDLVERNNANTKQTEELINTTNAAIKKITQLSENIKTSISEQVDSSSAISAQLQNATTGTKEIAHSITEIARLGEKLKI